MIPISSRMLYSNGSLSTDKPDVSEKYHDTLKQNVFI